MTSIRLTTAAMAARSSASRMCAVAIVGVACLTSTLSAQRIPDLNAPKRAAQNAADAENARLSAQTGQEVPARRGTSAAPAPAPSIPSGPGAPTQRVGTSNGPSTTAPPIMAPVTREIFTYADEGRRDPFFSLILTEDLRPLLSDLKLVAVLYDASGRRSVAVMRDVATNAQYRVNPGQAIGRMRVAQIKPRVVIFTLDEFGLSRQDSLFLVDSTKVKK